MPMPQIIEQCLFLFVTVAVAVAAAAAGGGGLAAIILKEHF